VIRTSGNPYAHVVLRGGNGKPNYDAGSVAEAEAALAKAKVSTKIMIDTSHANSNKDPFLQPLVLKILPNKLLMEINLLSALWLKVTLKVVVRKFLKTYAILNTASQ
jgi:phospho-2-dehydro-3-deoxyheptonate aldolase